MTASHGEPQSLAADVAKVSELDHRVARAASRGPGQILAANANPSLRIIYAKSLARGGRNFNGLNIQMSNSVTGARAGGPAGPGPGSPSSRYGVRTVSKAKGCGRWGFYIRPFQSSPFQHCTSGLGREVQSEPPGLLSGGSQA